MIGAEVLVFMDGLGVLVWEKEGGGGVGGKGGWEGGGSGGEGGEGWVERGGVRGRVGGEVGERGGFPFPVVEFMEVFYFLYLFVYFF